MKKWWKLKLIIVLLVTATSAGCALAVVDQALGDKKATHAEDQSAEPSETGGNQGDINN